MKSFALDLKKMSWATTSWEKVLPSLNCLTNLISFRVEFSNGYGANNYGMKLGKQPPCN